MTPKPCRANCGATVRGPQPYCPACEFMTPPEAMSRLHISQPTFYRWVKAGKFTLRQIGPATRGSKRLVLRAEVDALLG